MYSFIVKLSCIMHVCIFATGSKGTTPNVFCNQVENFTQFTQKEILIQKDI